MRHLMMVFALLLSLGAVAKDLGRMGPTFPIGEIDMLTWIEARLKHFEATGKLEQMQTEFAEQVKQSVETPPPLSLSTTTTPKTFLVDPSITVPKDLTDAQGRVFAKAGTRVNPFDTRTWPTGAKLPQFEYSNVLVFFDARDAKQVEFVANLEHAKPLRYILTGGSP
ncbi:type-F conjugative transfer system protein TraW, partial [Vibrio cyclitrophicus]